MIAAPRVLEIREDHDAAPGPGQVAVAVRGCGVCGSNVPVWEGRPWFDYPLPLGAPGHEAWGEIHAIGDGVTGLRPGDAVALLSTTAFRDTVVAAPEEVVKLPADLAGVSFPGEALGCGFNIARRSMFQPGDTVAVVGCGFIGALVVKLAAVAGARVIAVSRRAHALDLARSLGAAETVAMDDHQRVIDAVGALTGGALCRTVVEAVGAQWPLDLAAQLTGFGGRLVVAGYHQDGPRSVDMQMWNWRGIDVINAHERDPEITRRGIREAADAVAAGWFDPSPLYTHIFPFSELGGAMDAMLDRPAGFTKALVVT